MVCSTLLDVMMRAFILFCCSWASCSVPIGTLP
jgi:hypothetical protein